MFYWLTQRKNQPFSGRSSFRMLLSGTSTLRMIVIPAIFLASALLSLPAFPQPEPDEAVSDGVEQKNGSSPDTTIVYTARDSLVYNIDGRTMELWGEASIRYEDMKLDAPKIVVDYTSSIFDAFAAEDSLGESTDFPVFTDKDGAFEAEHMKYNYATRKGRTVNVSSEIEEGFYTGANVKRLETGELYVKDGMYTTCPKDDPDFWFYGKDMKIIPDDKIVARPLILYVRPKPFSLRLPAVPLVPLPFMYLPIKTDRTSGFLIPRFGEDDRGIYFSNLGYFWAFSDYMDLRLESDVALNGSWRLGERFRYAKRYLFDGYLEGEYERYILAHPDDPDYVDYDNWNVKLVHHHRFDPTARFDLNLFYQGGRRYYDISSINNESIINEQANSYASFSKTFDGGSRSLTASYQRSEDLRDNDLTQSISTSFYQERLYPFRSEGTSADDWQSRFSLTPRATASAVYSTLDNLDYSDYTADASLRMAFRQDFARGYNASFSQRVELQGKLDNNPVEDDRWGVRLELPFSVNSTLFRYFNVNSSFNYNNYYVNSFIEKYYDDIDDEVVTETIDSPSHYSTYSLDADVQTRLYGTMYTRFLEDFVGIKALRHTVIPSLTFSWNPDFTGDNYDYYDTYLDALNQPVRYNKYMDAIYNNVFEERSEIGLSVQNLLQAKVKGEVSPEGIVANDRILQLLSLTASTSYNFAADSLKLAPLKLSASSNALAPNLLLRAGATYDFYSFDPVTGDRIDKLYIDDGGGLLRFVQGFLNMSLSLKGSIDSKDKGKKQSGGEKSADAGDNGKKELNVEEAIYKERYNQDSFRYLSSRLPWQLRLSLYLNSNKYEPLEPAVTTFLLNTSAKVSLSKTWHLGLNTGYDIENQEFIYPQINLYGDFECWDMSFQWVPVGEYESYFFQIGIKAPHLQDIRVRQSGRLGDTS